MHAKEVHGMLIGCAEWFFNAAELYKLSVEAWMSAMGSFTSIWRCPGHVRFAPVTSIGQCNTSCSLLAGVSKAKVFRGRSSLPFA
jgi:hypothetical protein